MPGIEQIRIRALEAADLEPLFGERGLDGEERLARQQRGEVLVAVAEVDGVAVGKMCLDLTSYESERAAYVFGAGVRPRWRSRGIGSMLDADLGQAALARGFRTLRCRVAKHNLRAQSFYERLGYLRIGGGLICWTEGGGREVEVDCWEFERPLDRP